MAETLHHRYHEQLHEYWDKLRSNRAFPPENEIDPEALDELWPYCFLISIDSVTHRLGYRYSYLGKSLIEAYGEDVNNPDVVLRLLSSADSSMSRKFDEVREEKHPVIDESEFVNLKNMRVKYRTAMLPLGTDDKVTHILGCMRWKMY